MNSHKTVVKALVSGFHNLHSAKTKSAALLENGFTANAFAANQANAVASLARWRRQTELFKWPSHRPYLNPLDFFFYGMPAKAVLKDHITEAFQDIDRECCRRAINRINWCITGGGLALRK